MNDGLFYAILSMASFCADTKRDAAMPVTQILQIATESSRVVAASLAVKS